MSDTREHWRTVWDAVQCHQSQITGYGSLAAFPLERHADVAGFMYELRTLMNMLGMETQRRRGGNNDATRELGREQEVPVVELARSLPKSSRLFYDFVHFTGEGAQAVATLMASGLCPTLARARPELLTKPCEELVPRSAN